MSSGTTLHGMMTTGGGPRATGQSLPCSSPHGRQPQIQRNLIQPEWCPSRLRRLLQLRHRPASTWWKITDLGFRHKVLPGSIRAGNCGVKIYLSAAIFNDINVLAEEL